MFLDPKPKPTLDRVIENAERKLNSMDPEDESFSDVLEIVSKLHKLREQEKPQRVSPDTLVLAAVNLVGIVLIIRHENINVITSKALSFVQKPR